LKVQGVIVGDLSAGHYDQTNAYILVNRQVTELNSRLPSGSPWTLLAATGINNLGQIVGYGTYNGVNEGFLLTPSTLSDPPSINSNAMIGKIMSGRDRSLSGPGPIVLHCLCCRQNCKEILLGFGS
jgi:probable HAF family extracellular repeat protein